ncbi:hypothetical protein CQA49_09210 [Helicobacter sp. MIT 00-7814]|nr:hypothetical protein CQA49_09210 [Helicobacter sp. MIT 00-7814]RDU51778.1 hypothetical protein CQA37_09355 [Helicobacter sp. MIT 99-10781]
MSAQRSEAEAKRNLLPQGDTINGIKKECALRELARRDLYQFLRLKWARYNCAPFLDNWHFEYIAKVLESTLPSEILDKNPRPPLTRLMINMPPSYGKTEVIARTFIAWALGHDRSRKFIYISYSDDLCRKINNQVRDLIKSPFWAQIFGAKPQFLQDNSNEFVFKEGGGLFVTTLKSAITGFHAHQILIDDPIKVSEMSSKSARDLVNTNFKESVLSRLQDNKSNITILMQRLGDEDLCGFLLNERNFKPEVIKQWIQINLQALNKNALTYKIGDYTHFRPKNTALFPLRHNEKELELLKLQMGEDEFSTQYLQEPQAREAGFFEAVYFKSVPSYEVGVTNDYIFIDNATSLNADSDNRAICCVGVERVGNLARFILKDCFFGIWSEEQTLSYIIEAMQKYPKAKVYIESDAGGEMLFRLLQKEVVCVNENLKKNYKTILTNQITAYPANRKIPKVEKIKAMRCYYNTGNLVFLHNASGINQIKKELLSFNPAKPFRKDDCIDALSSCIAHPDVRPPSAPSTPLRKPQRNVFYANKRAWNI